MIDRASERSKNTDMRKALWLLLCLANQENDRMRMRRSDTPDGSGKVRDSFDLPPYGVVLVFVRKLD
jgi:hypothetical protein